MRMDTAVFRLLCLVGVWAVLGCGSKASTVSGAGGSPPEVGSDGGCLPAGGWADGVPRTSDGKAITFYPAVDDPWLGDWQGQGGYVAQVFAADGTGYRANLLHAFAVPNDAPVAV